MTKIPLFIKIVKLVKLMKKKMHYCLTMVFHWFIRNHNFLIFLQYYCSRETLPLT